MARIRCAQIQLRAPFSVLAGSRSRLRRLFNLLKASSICQRKRFSPAPAGNTAAPDRSPEIEPVQPRACGEHLMREGTAGSTGGSAPRLRGTLRCNQSSPWQSRFSPAPAGNTRGSCADRTRRAVQPRACGEHWANCSRHSPNCGSAPRLRGTLERHSARHATRRFSPAPAGNTTRYVTRYVTNPVQPRACGEHLLAISRTAFTAGSAPRLRGTPSNGHSV